MREYHCCWRKRQPDDAGQLGVIKALLSVYAAPDQGHKCVWQGGRLLLQKRHRRFLTLDGLLQDGADVARTAHIVVLDPLNSDQLVLLEEALRPALSLGIVNLIVGDMHVVRYLRCHISKLSSNVA